MAKLDLASLAAEIEELARGAGRIIAEIYATPFAVEAKADHSPVTLADRRAEEFILAGLGKLTPALPIIAEERVSAIGAPSSAGDLFWLVDPLDGTTEFVAKRDEFCVNIALVRDGAPILGVVHAPTNGVSYGGALAMGAWRRDAFGQSTPIAARTPKPQGLRVALSRSHREAASEAWLAAQKFAIAEMVLTGSALKFCRLAEGDFDLYPRFGPTNEWDTAAGHAVLAAAGGSVRTLDGGDLRYGKPGFKNPPFIARGRA